MTFQKGHTLGLGNQHAKGHKHSEAWKEAARQRMLGNTNGFVTGKTSPRKGKKSSVPAWNKGLKVPQQSGINHPLWIADRSKLKDDHKERGGQLHREWSKSVKNRDGWKCKISDKDCGGRLESHHILGWKSHPKLRYEINNGIALCHFHHPRKREAEESMIPTFLKLLTPSSHT